MHIVVVETVFRGVAEPVVVAAVAAGVEVVAAGDDAQAQQLVAYRTYVAPHVVVVVRVCGATRIPFDDAHGALLREWQQFHVLDDALPLTDGVPPFFRLPFALQLLFPEADARALPGAFALPQASDAPPPFSVSQACSGVRVQRDVLPLHVFPAVVDDETRGPCATDRDQVVVGCGVVDSGGR